MLHLRCTIAIPRERRHGIHEVFHSGQQVSHPSTLMIARDSFMQLVPQPFDVINPRTVNWLEHQAELGVLLQPSLGLFAFVNDVVIEDQRDGFGSSVVATQLFQHGDKQG